MQARILVSDESLRARNASYWYIVVLPEHLYIASVSEHYLTVRQLRAIVLAIGHVRIENLDVETVMVQFGETSGDPGSPIMKAFLITRFVLPHNFITSSLCSGSGYEIDDVVGKYLGHYRSG